jgi:predicted RNase H-like nuclease (RuvC/YqgF family)
MGLEQVLQLRPVQFQYIQDIDQDNQIKYGLIAQEVEKVIPYLVKQDQGEEGQKDADSAERFKTLNYMNLIPILIKSIQQQQEKNDQLKDRVRKLEDEIEQIKQLLNQ